MSYPSSVYDTHSDAQLLIGHKVVVQENAPGQYCEFELIGLNVGTETLKISGKHSSISILSPGDMSLYVDKVLSRVNSLEKDFSYCGAASADKGKEDVVIFDVVNSDNCFLGQKEMEEAAAKIGAPVAKTLWSGDLVSYDILKKIISQSGTPYSVYVKAADRSVGQGKHKELVVVKLTSAFDLMKTRSETKPTTVPVNNSKEIIEYISLDSAIRDGITRPIMNNFCGDVAFSGILDKLSRSGIIQYKMNDLGALITCMQAEVNAMKDTIKEDLWTLLHDKLKGYATSEMVCWYKELLKKEPK